MAFPDARAAYAALANRSATLADLRQIVTDFPELRPWVAAYPGTDEALLGWLAALQDPQVDAELATRNAGAAAWSAPVTTGSGVAPSIFAPASPVTNAQAAAPAYQAQPGLPGRTTKRFGWPLVVGAVIVLGLVAGGLSAAFATGMFAPKAASGTSSAGPVRTASAVPSEAETASQVATPGESGAASRFVCWDGAESDTAGDCILPEGKDEYWSFLTYAFPSIASQPGCTEADSTGKSTYVGVTVMWECELGDALIRYRYWEVPSDAEEHYARKFNAKTVLKTYDLLVGGAPTEGWAKTDKDTVDGPAGVQRVVLTIWLPEDQLSVSVEGDTSAAMWAALEQVRTRPGGQMYGHPAQERAVEAPITVEER
ncbi:MAG TPA: hypothetical protein PKJ61_03805 [Propionicimonas sp.]|nr:hypothetical protein [Propionicimonas sp.]